MKLSERQLDAVAKAAAEVTLEYLEKKEKQQLKRKHDYRLRNMKLLLRNYRSLKKHCDAIPGELKKLDEEISLVSFDREELALESIKRSKERTMLMVQFVDKMLLVYKLMCEQSDKPEDLRSYQAVYQLYISEDRFTAKEIATCHKTDVRTVYRDVDKATKALSALIFGIDAIKFR